ncbi:MAG: TldD/PmbA family protein [Pseudomonadota bacterium]|nr:TldD/PmbA family protein [Pseudomonadota bacterium]
MQSTLDQLDAIASRFAGMAPAVDYWSLRLVEEEADRLAVRQGVVEPGELNVGRGAMVTVVKGRGLGYGATSDLSPSGLRAAAGRAVSWAEFHARHGLLDAAHFPRSQTRSEYCIETSEPWDGRSIEDKLALLRDACAALKIDERIVDWSAWLLYHRTSQLLVTSDLGQVSQVLETVSPGLAAVANEGSQTQRRTGGGTDWPGQGGLERLDLVGFPREAGRVAEEAIALLGAPECPTGTMDLVLLPSQMVLQIHESIGHPLELDRILGDERNYAGTSFVTPEMFGSYRYGSPLLNVTFDPTIGGELASYSADDEGTPAERAHLIRDGILERPLGGRLSQARSGLPGVANARASGWDRPPIDRMANINLEPGDSSLQGLIGRVERGVLMDTNRSWSIDDSRNKFQFGCELGRLIEDGELKGLVRNPGYRGISESFWRSLGGVGDRQSLQVRGLRNCGKGEPNQVVCVGHASPPCLFRDVALFGGGE